MRRFGMLRSEGDDHRCRWSSREGLEPSPSSVYLVAGLWRTRRSGNACGARRTCEQHPRSSACLANLGTLVSIRMLFAGTDFCSMAGAGRTGTFISLASLLSDPLAKPKTGMLPTSSHHSDPVYATVDSIRDFRGRQVLTPGQLGLIHDIVDSKNGVPFSGIKRRPSESSNTSM